MKSATQHGVIGTEDMDCAVGAEDMSRDEIRGVVAPHVGMRPCRYSSMASVPLAKMAARGILNGLPSNCKDLK